MKQQQKHYFHLEKKKNKNLGLNFPASQNIILLHKDQTGW